MRKIIVLIILLFAFVANAAGAKKQGLADIQFPGDANFEWGLSKSDIYKEDVKIEPKELAKQISQIEKLDTEKNCSKALALYEKVQREYPDKPFVYNQIPNCPLDESVYDAVSTFVMKGGEVESVKSLESYYQTGAEYFNNVFKKSEVTLEELKAALDFKLGYAAFNFIDKLLTALATVKDSAEFKNYYLSFLSEEIAQIASDDNILIGREILKRDPNNMHAKALLGTLIVGNSWTKIVNSFIEQSMKKKDLDIVEFVKARGKEINFDEPMALLEPVCTINNYQACQDLATLYMLKGSYDKGRDYFYKAFQMNPSNRKPIGGILFTMVLEKLDDFKSDKAKEVASKFVDMMVKRLNKADEAYDYLIVAKVLYRLDRDAESLKYINDGLKAFAGDPMLNFAKAIVLTKENNFNDAKKILDGITANLDDTNKKEAEKLQMYIAGK